MSKSTIVERRLEETTQNVVSVKRFSSNRLPSGAPSVDMRCFVNKPSWTVCEISLRGSALESGLPILQAKVEFSHRAVGRRRFIHWEGDICSTRYLSEDDRQAIAQYDDMYGDDLAKTNSDYADIERDFELVFDAARGSYDAGPTVIGLFHGLKIDYDTYEYDINYIDQNISTAALAEAWESGEPTPWPNI